MEEQPKKIFEVIEEILVANKYQRIDLQNCLSKVFQEVNVTTGNKIENALYMLGEKNVQYILVMDFGQENINVEKMLDLQLKVYEELLRANDKLSPDFDKNVYLLLCMNADILNNDVEKMVLLLEEDPYCFKKLVLTYTNEELLQFKDNASECSTWFYIQSLVNRLKKEGANDFKDSDTRFVLKLLIKLPFLPVDIVVEEEKKDLLTEMEQTMQPEYFKLWQRIKNQSKDEITNWKSFDKIQMEALIAELCGEEEV